MNRPSIGRRLVRLILLTGVLSAAPGFIASAIAQCSLSVTPVSFGNYDVFQTTARDVTATVTVTCIVSLNVQVQMNRGQFATSFSPRQMNRNGERLNYSLYFDSTRTQTWGDGTASTVVWNTGVFIGTRNQTVYARIPALQNVTIGAYTDTVTVTAIF